MDWVKLIAQILAVLAALIPLVYQLVKYVKQATKEKNWNKMLELLMGYMERAEAMFDSGADRKEWVMAMIEVATKSINYDIDMSVVSDLIDSLCDMSKVVNGSTEAA